MYYRLDLYRYRASVFYCINWTNAPFRYRNTKARELFWFSRILPNFSIELVPIVINHFSFCSFENSYDAFFGGKSSVREFSRIPVKFSMKTFSISKCWCKFDILYNGSVDRSVLNIQQKRIRDARRKNKSSDPSITSITFEKSESLRNKDILYILFIWKFKFAIIIKLSSIVFFIAREFQIGGLNGFHIIIAIFDRILIHIYGYDDSNI